MLPQPMILESQNAMSAADGATTERRTRINRPDEERGRCKGSRASGRRKDFSQCMQQSTTPSTSNVISHPLPLGLGAIRSGSMGCGNFDNIGFPCHHYPTCSAASPSPRNHRSRSFPKLACHRLDPQIGPALTPPRAERTAGRLKMSMSRDRRLGRRVQKAYRGTRRPKSGGYARR